MLARSVLAVTTSVLLALSGCGTSSTVDTLHPAVSVTLRMTPAKQKKLFDLLETFARGSDYEFAKGDMPPKDGRELVNIGLHNNNHYALLIDNVFAADEFGVALYPSIEGKVEPNLIPLLNQVIALSEGVIELEKCDTDLVDCEKIVTK